MKAIVDSIGRLMIGIIAGAMLAGLSGESPLKVLRVLLGSAFGSPYDLAMTLFYATPLILTGLSVAVAFRAGLFNVGAEGQLVLGALAAAAVGATVRGLPPVLGVFACACAAALTGAAWATLAGWLKVRRGAHEVITTIMLNFVAMSLASFVTLYMLRNPETQNPETIPVPDAYMIPNFAWAGEAPLGWSLPFAALLAVLVAVFFARSRLGYEIRMVGLNPRAAAVSALSVARGQIGAMALAGALAGLVGVPEVLGAAGRFKPGFSPDYGFIGIAVALLARGNPIGILASALLFGALHKGAGDLDLETEYVTRDLSYVLQGLVILAVGSRRR